MRLLLLSLPLLLQCPAISGLRSQFEVDCPHGCQCTKNTIECVRIGSPGSDVFLPMRPEAYPDLDTINVTQNSIGDISGQNLFGMNVVHHSVSLLNLSHNEITAFDNETFQGLPALEYFYLNNNSIQRVSDDPFRWNTRLRYLDLSNAFSRSLSVADKQEILRKMFFLTANRFLDLKELLLQHNALTRLAPDAFCKMEGLVRLQLSGNALQDFPFSDECLVNLRVLELSGNNFITPSVRLWDGLPGIQSIDISSNPLRCDCKIAPFIERLRSSSSSALNQGRTICASPSSVKGLNAIEVADFDCSPHHHFFLLLLVACALLLVVAAIRVYRGRLRFVNLPFVAGYTKLGTSEAVTPQFV